VDIVRSLIDIYKNEEYMPDGRSRLSNGITQALIKDDDVDPGSHGLYESRLFLSKYQQYVVKRLIKLSGGSKEFESHLDKTFADKSYQSGYYNIGNEPDFFHICLYHFIGKQYKSVKVIRDILKTKFGSGQDGIPDML
ncbi:3388_t:CDS:2, partial [Racocetra fulgida]